MNNKNKMKKSLKSNMGVVVSMLVVLLVVMATVFVVSAEKLAFYSGSDTSGEEFTTPYAGLEYEYNRKNSPVYYKLTADNGGVSDMVVPARRDVYIEVAVDKEGYYKIYITADANTGNIPTICKFDESGVAVQYSSQKENESVLMMYLEKGIHSFGFFNASFDNDARYYFNAEHCDDLLVSVDSDDIIPIDFYTDVKLKPAETKVLSIENTKDSYTNFICAEGVGLSVEIFDGNLVSCGYDSSDINEPGGICQYVVMRENGTDRFFAVVSNASDKEINVSYKTDLQVACRDCRNIKLNAAMPLAEDGGFYVGQGLFCFTPDKTREYEFSFASFTDAEIKLTLRDMIDYSCISVEESGFISNGTLIMGNLLLEEGKTYVVIIDSYSENICNPNVMVK